MDAIGRGSEHRQASDERGSALVMAIFVLVLLGAMGVVLLFVTENEVKAGQVDQRAKKVFYLAEAGLEGGRETLRVTNLSDPLASNRGTFDDELAAAAGGNGTFDVSADTLKPVYDAAGKVTGFTGYGDDVPVRPMTAFGRGVYAAFLVNDIVDVSAPLTDSNDRVMIIAIGAGSDRSVEIVQGMVERKSFPPLPATITMVGPSADFDGGASAAKEYSGDDCPGGIPGFNVPAIGTFDPGSEASAEVGVRKPGSYSQGAESGVDTVDDVAGAADPLWQDCDFLVDLARQVRSAADLVGNSSTPESALGVPGSPLIVYIEGDYTVDAGVNGAGMLFVTGNLEFHGNSNWYGTIFAVGKGTITRSGNGNGDIDGAVLVADVAGPDRTLHTGDDCAGQDGVLGTTDDGAATGTYSVNGAGSSSTEYCSTAIAETQDRFPLSVIGFRQR